jgi:hypothetical protein
VILQEHVFKKLKNLKVDKSPGPDGLHPKVLKEMAGILDLPLTMLFNKSLETNILPREWKQADVISLFKRAVN